MIVYDHKDGGDGGDVTFYSIEDKVAGNYGTFLNDDRLQGAGILQDSDGDGTYSSSGNTVGDVDMYQYRLPKDWQKASDGKGIVATMPRADAMDIAKLIIGTGLVATGEGILPMLGAGLEVLTVIEDIERVPVYQEQRPTRYYIP